MNTENNILRARRISKELQEAIKLEITETKPVIFTFDPSLKGTDLKEVSEDGSSSNSPSPGAKRRTEYSIAETKKEEGSEKEEAKKEKTVKRPKRRAISYNLKELVKEVVSSQTKGG
jgi:ribosomal protein L12E/L44/L45/RPP1/RPP2